MKRGLQCIIWTLEQCRQIMWYFHISQRIFQVLRQVLQSRIENEVCSRDEWLQQLNNWMQIEKQLQEKLFWFLPWIQIRWQSQDDMKTVWLMIQLRQKFFEIHHKASQVEPKFQFMSQKHCWIEFKQDCNKSTALAILVCIMKHLKSVLACWIIATTGEINFLKQKRVVATMTSDFEVDVIEIVWCLEMFFFVQIENMNSTIWRFKVERASDLNDNECLQ